MDMQEFHQLENTSHNTQVYTDCNSLQFAYWILQPHLLQPSSQPVMLVCNIHGQSWKKRQYIFCFLCKLICEHLKKNFKHQEESMRLWTHHNTVSFLKLFPYLWITWQKFLPWSEILCADNFMRKSTISDILWTCRIAFRSQPSWLKAPARCHCWLCIKEIQWWTEKTWHCINKISPCLVHTTEKFRKKNTNTLVKKWLN